MKGKSAVTREMESMVEAWWLMPSSLSAPRPKPSPSAEGPPWELVGARHPDFSAALKNACGKTEPGMS